MEIVWEPDEEEGDQAPDPGLDAVVEIDQAGIEATPGLPPEVMPADPAGPDSTDP
jgi:hypothetical protein